MKLFNFILILVFTHSSFAQVIVLQEDFTGYLGTAQTMPLGWSFSYHGHYTTSVSSGSSGPNAYKFGAAGTTTINTPVFSQGADTLSFWIKGVSTDTISKLIVFQSNDSITWDTLAKICPLPTSGAQGYKKFGLQSATTHLRFSYVKSVGNLAFDDFKLIRNLPVANFTSDIVSGCNPVCVKFTDQSTSGITNWSWNFGDGDSSTDQHPSHCYTSPGDYTVTLKIGSSSLSNTVIKTNYIQSHTMPTASFIASPSTTTLSNPTITFANQSVDAISWLWNFGDGTTSTLMNSTHSYSDTGYYCTWLTAIAAFGCKDSVSKCIQVNSTLTSTNVLSENLKFAIYPNPSADGHLTIELVQKNLDGIIVICNTLGEIVKTITTNQAMGQVYYLDLYAGIYFVQVKQGNISGTQKIIVLN